VTRDIVGEYVKLGQTEGFRPGETAFVRIDGKAVLLVNVEGQFYALSNFCSHSRCYLHQGKLKGKVITCPCHFAEFDVTTGAALSPPAKESLDTYPVRIEGTDILVAL
jgi:naphthalene 1,2-dioxygenase system ferredoxin subunit